MAIKFVDPAGNNGNNGNTRLTAYRDIVYAISQIASGDTIVIYGTGSTRFDYDENIANGIPGANSWALATRIQAAAGENVWLAPSYSPDYAIILNQTTQRYIEFSGISIDGNLTTYGPVKIEPYASPNNLPHHIRIQNCEVTATNGTTANAIVLDAQVASVVGGNEIINCLIHDVSGQDFCHGVYIKSSNNLVDHCNIYNIPGGCVHIYNATVGTDAPNGNIVSRNRLHDGSTPFANERHIGIWLGDFGRATNTQIYDNIIFHTPQGGGGAASAGILVQQTCNNALIYQNTITANDGRGLTIDSGATGAIYRNNIIYDNTGGNISDSGSGGSSSNNLQTNPNFVNPGANDFTILNTSAAYHNGVNLSGAVPSDALYGLWNNPPSQGAYEVIDMAGVWTRIGATNTGSSDAQSAITNPIDTSGATLIVANMARYVGISGSVTFTDSYGNTWIDTADNISGNGIATRLMYCINPTVGAAHTFTASNATDYIFPAVCIEAWKGQGTNPFVGQNGSNTLSGATLATGNLSAGTNAIYFAGLAFDDNSAGAVTISQSFAATVQTLIFGLSIGGAIAYLVSAASATKNPTWDVTNAPSDGMGASIIAFASDQAGSVFYYPMLIYARR